DDAHLRERLVARDLAVAPAEDARRGAARRGERLEAQALKHARRTSVPRVGNDEGSRPFMQGLEALGFLALVHSMRMLLSRTTLPQRATLSTIHFSVASGLSMRTSIPSVSVRVLLTSGSLIAFTSS